MSSCPANDAAAGRCVPSWSRCRARRIDRYLAGFKASTSIRGISTTRPGPLLRNSIQIRTAGDGRTGVSRGRHCRPFSPAGSLWRPTDAWPVPSTDPTPCRTRPASVPWPSSSLPHTPFAHLRVTSINAVLDRADPMLQRGPPATVRGYRYVRNDHTLAADIPDDRRHVDSCEPLLLTSTRRRTPHTTTRRREVCL